MFVLVSNILVMIVAFLLVNEFVFANINQVFIDVLTWKFHDVNFFKLNSQILSMGVGI